LTTGRFPPFNPLSRLGWPEVANALLPARVACDVTADMSGVGAREVELGQFVIGLSSASVVPLVSLREQFRNVG